jgi:hypothetical protein
LAILEEVVIGHGEKDKSSQDCAGDYPDVKHGKLYLFESTLANEKLDNIEHTKAKQEHIEARQARINSAQTVQGANAKGGVWVAAMWLSTH